MAWHNKWQRQVIFQPHACIYHRYYTQTCHHTYVHSHSAFRGLNDAFITEHKDTVHHKCMLRLGKPRTLKFRAFHSPDASKQLNVPHPDKKRTQTRRVRTWKPRLIPVCKESLASPFHLVPTLVKRRVNSSSRPL